ncbi:hypothetical protein llap_8406 [Limosa lapponica baueri]|uniref:Uncharacterized protein n=1 Tax=Limosa lapponica baueri TaxID=1758121 RepID=A0A2I0U5H6_LIMLA|nr:hypothetical protein llap_8406 [Limosa lapponica baueri]
MHPLNDSFGRNRKKHLISISTGKQAAGLGERPRWPESARRWAGVRTGSAGHGHCPAARTDVPAMAFCAD